ncbi:hypothetical protein PAAG_07260 [Paracoccidioides lutzii Pb01]|uniref:Uncharacterized protein n=1 Tax=Paracoccidioides lutzii (strain ATCC MYA-826 / Pb01) TaxID=502779 RepID=C1H919_PARBA|nr:hypothetical protein PAAG_07260 [Paracoccidioides lutzii Pb01]EEH36842.2 hypothetical protein PAAG_07260 [Paracoccidioides lutzii Pb01]
MSPIVRPIVCSSIIYFQSLAIAAELHTGNHRPVPENRYTVGVFVVAEEGKGLNIPGYVGPESPLGIVGRYGSIRCPLILLAASPWAELKMLVGHEEGRRPCMVRETAGSNNMDLDRARYQAEKPFRHIKPRENAEVAFIGLGVLVVMPDDTLGVSSHYPKLDLGIFSASQHR